MVPNALCFKIFGTKRYPTVLNKPKGNHNPRALIGVGVFVDYQEQQIREWKIYLPESNQFIITAHIYFEKDRFNKNLQEGQDTTSEPEDTQTTTTKRYREEEDT